MIQILVSLEWISMFSWLCPGGRISKRKAQRSRIGYSHKVTREDAMEWFKKQYDGIILDKAK